MNRRGFLKAISCLVGAAAVPTALVAACQIDAPVPKDWIVGLLDIDGNVYAQAWVGSLGESITFPTATRTAVLTEFFVEGGDLPKRVVGKLNPHMLMSAGITATISDIALTVD